MEWRLTLLIAFGWFPLFAQQRVQIMVLSRYSSNGMALRWAPTDAATWESGNRFGYVIERVELLENGDMRAGSKEVISPTPVKPASEAGFLQFEAVSKESAVLHEVLYNKEYDGAPVAAKTPNLQRVRERENRYGIAMLMCDLSPVAARAGGLYFFDKGAQRGIRYAYRISIAEPSRSKTSGVLVALAEESPALAEIRDLKADFGDRKVTIQWNTLLHRGIYSAYYVERSLGGEPFKQVSELPYVHMSEHTGGSIAVFVDSLAVNDAAYRYRIRGISPFGEKGNFSNIVEGYGRENVTGKLIIRSGVAEQDVTKITWEFPAQLESRVKHFTVSVARKHEGPFTDVGAVASRSSREATVTNLFTNSYFIIRAVDEHGKELVRSFPFLVQVPDDTPPGSPQGLFGSVSNMGVVKLVWTANNDDDLLGYRVFRSNTADGDLMEITREILAQTGHTDTVNMDVLNRSIYYSVVAVDRSFNTSGYSDLLLLRRPDVHPPVAPVMTNFEIAGDTVKLGWTNSPSPDVERHELIEVELDERISRTILTWRPVLPVTSFVDRTFVAGKRYRYKVVAFDSAGNQASVQTREFLFEPGYRSAVKTVDSKVDREGRQIRLAWTNPAVATKCHIFRKENDGNFILYETLQGNAESFEDRRVMINNVYSYMIQPCYSGGIQSLPSKAITLVY